MRCPVLAHQAAHDEHHPARNHRERGRIDTLFVAETERGAVQQHDLQAVRLMSRASEENAGSKRALDRVDLLSISQFQDELRQARRFVPRPPTTDALGTVVRKIQQNPDYTQSRLLTRILAALTYQEGDFRRAEAAALDVDSLAIAVTLMDDYAAGTGTRDDWIRAVDTARAAQGDGTYSPASSRERPSRE